MSLKRTQLTVSFLLTRTTSQEKGCLPNWCVRFVREEDETLGLSFKKELTLADEQIFPPPSGSDEKNGLTRLQERLLKKLGTSSIPFTLTFPRHSPTSVTLAPNADDPPGCLPCGVEYYIRCYVLEAGARP